MSEKGKDRKILVDMTAYQYGTKYHGGGEYGHTVFKEMIEQKKSYHHIDAFVDKIVVYKDHFEWFLTFNKDSIKCLVEGSRKVNSKATIINNLLCKVDEETGCYR